MKNIGNLVRSSLHRSSLHRWGFAGAILLMALSLSACDKERVVQAGSPIGGGGGGGAGAPIAVYEGLQGTTPCKLFVHSESHVATPETPATYRAIISTSFEHDGEGLGQVEVQFTEEAGVTLLHWKKGIEEVKISLDPAATKLENPSGFSVRWLHDDHPHFDACTGLKAVAP